MTLFLTNECTGKPQSILTLCIVTKLVLAVHCKEAGPVHLLFCSPCSLCKPRVWGG